MSKYANCYRGAEPNIHITELARYHVMIDGKRSMERYGAHLLAEYRARRKQ
jgi:hypothetical protein